MVKIEDESRKEMEWVGTEMLLFRQRRIITTIWVEWHTIGIR